MVIFQSIIVMGAIAVVAGLVLVVAYAKLKVEEDPRVEKIMGSVPGVNCGACGYASCHAYAVAVSSQGESIELCKVGGASLATELAGIMGLEHDSDAIGQKAIVACGVKERKILAEYRGPQTCASAQLIGGGIACKYGCMGYGDCVSVCPFDAIKMGETVPKVDIEKCTGCGLCVKACPRSIISLESMTLKKLVYVACNNKQPGKITRQICSSGCIACKICEKKAPEGCFSISDNLSKVVRQDPGISIEEIKCPTKCIDENF